MVSRSASVTTLYPGCREIQVFAWCVPGRPLFATTKPSTETNISFPSPQISTSQFPSASFMSWFPYFAVAYNKETAGMFWLDRLYLFLFRLDGLDLRQIAAK